MATVAVLAVTGCSSSHDSGAAGPASQSPIATPSAIAVDTPVAFHALGAPLPGFSSWVNSVSSSPDGHTLATGT
jgi:hypothetical protein